LFSKSIDSLSTKRARLVFLFSLSQESREEIRVVAVGCKSGRIRVQRRERKQRGNGGLASSFSREREKEKKSEANEKNENGNGNENDKEASLPAD